MPRVRCGLPNGRDYLARIGPRLDVQVGFDPHFHQPVGRPNIPDDRRVALIDSGASASTVSAGLTLASEPLGSIVIAGRLGAASGGVNAKEPW